MRKIILLICSSILLSASVVDTVWVDPSISKMNWVGYKITGSHDGHIAIEDGYVIKKDDLIIGGQIVVDMQSITVDDIKNIERNGYLVSHLKNEDFFDVDKFPKAYLQILSSKKISSEDMIGSNISIEGNLIIKDISNKVVINANVDFNKNISRGQLIIDRTKWDIKYASNSFYELGDRAMYDDFVINFLLFPKK